VSSYIYNTAHFVGVPLDVLVRKYRSECVKCFESIESAAGDFLEYLKQFKHSDRNEDQFLFNNVFDALTLINSYAMRDFEDAAKNPPKGVGPREFIIQTLSKRIAVETSKEEKRPMSGFLDDITYEMFESRFGKIIDSASKRSLAPINISAALAEQIKKICICATKKLPEVRQPHPS
jgi:hypothetical protein